MYETNYKVTNIILIIFIIMYFISLFFPQIIFLLGLSPSNIINQPWTIITNIFLHENIFHLLFNSLALYSFGALFENLYGTKRFLILFFLSGIFGNILYILLNLDSHSIGIGASGALSGLLGCLAILRPRDEVIIFPIPIPISLYTALIIWILINIFGIIFPMGNIGYSAHLGGTIFGILYGEYMIKKSNIENIHYV